VVTTAAVQPLRVQKLFNSKYPESEVTALALSDSRTQQVFTGSSAAGPAATGPGSLLIAVGLAAGHVYLFSGDVSGAKGKLHHTGKLTARPDRGESWKVNAIAFTPVHSSSSSSSTAAQATALVPGLSGASTQVKGSGRAAGVTPGPGPAADAAAAAHAGAVVAAEQQEQWLYVVTESQTLAFHIGDLSKTILDQQGVHSGLCAVLKDKLLLVARDDALYEYTQDTRAGCTAFDGEQHIHITFLTWIQLSILPALGGRASSAGRCSQCISTAAAAALKHPFLTQIKVPIEGHAGRDSREKLCAVVHQALH